MSGWRGGSWPATGAQKAAGRRDKVICYQYRADRGRRTLRGIDEQVAKAEKAVAGLVPVKRNRFITLAAGQNTVNRELEARARALAGLKGYTTNLGACPGPPAAGTGSGREPLRPVAGRQTAGHSRTPARAADRSCPPEPAVPRPAHGRCRSRSSAPFSARTPARPERSATRRRTGYWPDLLAEVDDALMWSSTGPGAVPVQDGARRGRGVARGRGESRVTVGVQAGRRCWGWCCR